MNAPQTPNVIDLAATAPADSPEGQRGELLTIVTSHKLLLAVFLTAGAALGYLEFVRSVPLYRSSARLHFVQTKPLMNLENAAYSELLGGRTVLETHAILIQAPVIRKEVLNDLANPKELMKHPLSTTRSPRTVPSLETEVDGNSTPPEGDLDPKSQLRKAPSETLALEPITPEFASESNSDKPALVAAERKSKRSLPEPLVIDEGTLARGLAATPNKDSTEIMDLTFTSTDSETSRRALDAWIRVYLAYLDRTQQSSSDKAVKYIEKAMGVLKDDLKEKEDRYAAFRAKAKSLLWSGDVGSNIHAHRMQEIEASRAQLMIELTQAKADVESVEQLLQEGKSAASVALMIYQRRRTESPNSDPVTSPQAFSQQLLPLLVEEQLMLQRVGAGHPKVKEIQRRIKALRGMAAEVETSPEKPNELRDNDRAMVNAYLDSLKHAVIVKEQQLAKLNQMFEDERQESGGMAKDENEDRAMREDLERTKKLFDAVVNKLDSAELIKDVGTLSVNTIVEPGPGDRVLAPAYQFVALGGFAGLFAGMVCAFLIEWSDKGYRSADEAVRDLGVPIFGHVPEIEAKLGNDTPFDSTLVTLAQRQSHAAEAYRAIRSIVITGSGVTDHRVLQVTSPGPGDGKSTLTANLAAAIATSGMRCLLVDCDFRRPRVHKLFKLDNGKGASSVLTGQLPLSEAVYANVVPLLDVLTSGPKVSNPSELFASKQFATFTNQLREIYDVVLLDSPPVLAVSEPASIAAVVDGVLLVLKMSRRSKMVARQAKETLSLVGANVLGIVVNGVGGSNSRYYGKGGSYYYSGSYYYGGGAYRYSSYYTDDTTHPASNGHPGALPDSSLVSSNRG